MIASAASNFGITVTRKAPEIFTPQVPAL